MEVEKASPVSSTGKSDSVRLRCDALRCEAVCAREEERFPWLVFPISPRVHDDVRPSVGERCAGSDLVYCIVREKESGDRYILTQSCVESYFENATYEIVNKMKGSELLGMKYEPLFDFAIFPQVRQQWGVSKS